MAWSRLLVLALVGVVDVCQSISMLASSDTSPLLTPKWIENVSFILPVHGIQHPQHQTAVATFAGKRITEYIDGAVMLGMSVQQYLPSYPMAAMIITGMKRVNQKLLREAGWNLITVPDWDSQYCGEGCDLEFLGRWHDSFEKINAFRLPFKRVLFMDSDTYIFKGHVKWLVTQLKLPSSDHIAMAKDGCKDEYNSGVMVFQPGVEVFRSMLTMVTQRRREQILDQNLVNSYYSGKVVEIERVFNCVDTVGIQPGQTQPCEHHCSKDAVIAHFTGHPKPTSPKRRLLELVRRPDSPGLACMHTNFGACGKWSEFYCDIRRHSRRLSADLQAQLQHTGTCCHPKMVSRKEARWLAKHGHHNGMETCLDCPATLRLWAPSPDLKTFEGSYMKTNVRPRKFHGGRPIYIRDNDMKNAPVYMFFIQERLAWSIGPNYKQNNVWGFAAMEAQCPRDAKYWMFHNGTDFDRKKLNIRAGRSGHNPPTDTEHIVWNLHRRRWEREQIVWEHGDGLTEKIYNSTRGGEEHATEEERDEKNATKNEESDVENGTTDSVEEDDKNATENGDIDAAENEKTESGKEDETEGAESTRTDAAEKGETESAKEDETKGAENGRTDAAEKGEAESVKEDDKEGAENSGTDAAEKGKTESAKEDDKKGAGTGDDE